MPCRFFCGGGCFRNVGADGLGVGLDLFLMLFFLTIGLNGFPSLEGRWQVSRGGGRQPRWSRDGTRLFFVQSQGGGGGPAQEAVMEVTVEREPELVLGSPQGAFSLQGNAFHGSSIGP